jgi:hypothetical protein
VLPYYGVKEEKIQKQSVFRCQGILCKKELISFILTVCKKQAIFVTRKRDIATANPSPFRNLITRFAANIDCKNRRTTALNMRMNFSIRNVTIGSLLLTLVIFRTSSASFIDIETPLEKRTTTSLIDGTTYHLVRFSVFFSANKPQHRLLPLLLINPTIPGHVGRI